MKRIEVVAAIIKYKDLTLCAQRGLAKYDYISKKYEFPGGKIEPGESKEDAIIREINEELHLDISSPEYFMTVEHTYPHFHITMHSFLCKIDHQEIVLTEHLEVQWLKKDEMRTLDWAAADIPIVDKLLTN
ncbi:MAG: (deoxy)nucleoside triphosphate pyrophosphohydrolase [Spirochaetales bacterium]|nr:(deoxy)nucleoside triphosphate pyrophosphohydrolase [Spirochaetales bacterium]